MTDESIDAMLVPILRVSVGAAVPVTTTSLRLTALTVSETSATLFSPAFDGERASRHLVADAAHLERSRANRHGADDVAAIVIRGRAEPRSGDGDLRVGNRPVRRGIGDAAAQRAGGSLSGHTARCRGESKADQCYKARSSEAEPHDNCLRESAQGDERGVRPLKCAGRIQRRRVVRYQYCAHTATNETLTNERAKSYAIDSATRISDAGRLVLG